MPDHEVASNYPGPTPGAGYFGTLNDQGQQTTVGYGRVLPTPISIPPADVEGRARASAAGRTYDDLSSPWARPPGQGGL